MCKWKRYCVRRWEEERKKGEKPRKLGGLCGFIDNSAVGNIPGPLVYHGKRYWSLQTCDWRHLTLDPSSIMERTLFKVHQVEVASSRRGRSVEVLNSRQVETRYKQASLASSCPHFPFQFPKTIWASHDHLRGMATAQLTSSCDSKGRKSSLVLTANVRADKSRNMASVDVRFAGLSCGPEELTMKVSTARLYGFRRNRESKNWMCGCSWRRRDVGLSFSVPEVSPCRLRRQGDC